MIISGIPATKIRGIGVHLAKIATLNGSLNDKVHLGSHKIYKMFTDKFSYNLELTFAFKKLSEVVNYKVSEKSDYRVLQVSLLARNVFNRGEVYSIVTNAKFIDGMVSPEFDVQYLIRTPNDTEEHYCIIDPVTKAGVFARAEGIAERHVDKIRIMGMILETVTNYVTLRFKE